MNDMREIIPTIWSIFKRDKQSEVQMVKRDVRRGYKIDGRMTRWIPYHFNKFYSKIESHWLFKPVNRPTV